MSNYVFSPSTLAFYPAALKDSYVAAGSWPEDGVEVEDDVFATFSGTPPEGKMRGLGDDNQPAWVEVPAPSYTEDQVKAQARGYRDAFLSATDVMVVPDFTICDMPLTDEQRTELTTTRETFKKWPTQAGWPLIELPEIPQWLLIEAVNQGYVVPTWPQSDA